MSISDDEVEAAAKGAFAELMVMAKEVSVPFDYITTISVGNYRVMRAALRAAAKVRAIREGDGEVTIRPLEWKPLEVGRWLHADSVTGAYEVLNDEHVERRKAEQQAKHDARINSALSTVAVSDAQLNLVHKCSYHKEHVWFRHEGTGEMICTGCGNHRSWLVKEALASSPAATGGEKE